MNSAINSHRGEKAIIECKFEDGRARNSLYSAPTFVETDLIKHNEPRPTVHKLKGQFYPMCRTSALLNNETYHPAESNGPRTRFNVDPPAHCGRHVKRKIEEKKENRQTSIEEKEEEDAGVMMTAKSINDALRAKYTFSTLSILPTVKNVVGPVPPRPTDPHCWSLDLKRKDIKLSAMVDSAAPILSLIDYKLENMKKQRKVLAAKIEDYVQEKAKYMVTSNPKSVFYSGPIKLPPTKLLEAVEYEGSGCNHRYGLPFRTVACKRFWQIHPEPIPDLRECRQKFKKEMFLGYHSSVFR